MATRVVRREGWHVNRKRVQRLWRDEGLETAAAAAAETAPCPARHDRAAAAPCARTMCGRSTSEFDETADQRRLKLANIVDEYTREALAMRVGRTLHRR